MSSWRILYVDDEASMREIAVVCLGLDPAFEVRACASGEEALEKLEGWAPDLVMLDVVMPGLDGPETLSRIRARPDGAALPVAFITARSDPADVARLTALGAVGVIAKPFNPLTLAGSVKPFLPVR